MPDHLDAGDIVMMTALGQQEKWRLARGCATPTGVIPQPVQGFPVEPPAAPREIHHGHAQKWTVEG